MKILIIGTPRSGSSNITLSLSNILKLDSFQEPYNYSHPKLKNRIYPEISSKGIVIKTLFHQTPKNVTDCFKFYKEEIKKFDRVIILARKDIKAAYESFNYNVVENEDRNWHNQYIYDDYKFNEDIFYSYLKWSLEIIEFSKLHNLNITWYEDLYSKDINLVEEITKTWNLKITGEQLIKELNRKPKYRKYRKRTII